MAANAFSRRASGMALAAVQGMKKLLILLLGRYAWRWFQKRKSHNALRHARAARNR